MDSVTHGNRRRALGVLAGLLLAGGSARAQSLSFDFNDFSSTSGLTLIGGSVHSDNTLCVTQAVASSRGAVWYTDQRAPVAGGFRTSFTFRLRDIGAGGADGLAFVVQDSAPDALGGSGGALGYATNLAFAHLPGQTGIARSLAVELDTWNNEANWGDFNNDNHVSVQTQGPAPNRPDNTASRGWANPGVNMSDSLAHTVFVEYLAPFVPGGLGALSVEMDGNSILQVPINLETTLGLVDGRAWIGFTAATGGAANAEVHELRDWHFFGNVPAPGTAALSVVGLLAAAGRRRRD